MRKTSLFKLILFLHLIIIILKNKQLNYSQVFYRIQSFMTIVTFYRLLLTDAMGILHQWQNRTPISSITNSVITCFSKKKNCWWHVTNRNFMVLIPYISFILKSELQFSINLVYSNYANYVSLKITKYLKEYVDEEISTLYKCFGH